MLIQINPFISGNPVQKENFINRRIEVSRVVGRILNHGQSSAIIGEPRSGKTSLLQYLQDPETIHALYGEQEKNLLFSYVDTLTLGGQFTPSDFWEHVLEPVEEAMGRELSPLKDSYLTCVKEDCGNFVLERLFGQLYLTGRRLVLLLDEFDAFLNNDVFHQSEFYGGLRSLASRSKGLVLIIGSRQSLSNLNLGTQEFNRTGSPYFNFLDEVPLRPFSQKSVNKLLAPGQERFTQKDNDFIHRLAGGHPYFLQTAAFELWEAYEDEELKFPEERWEITGENLYARAQQTLLDIWRLWPAVMKKAFGTIAFGAMPRLLAEKEFYIPNLLKKLSDYAPELKELKRRGFIKDDEELESGYNVTAEVMLWFVADELLKALREDEALGTWLHREEWDGVFTVGEKKQLTKAAKSFGWILKDGIEIFMQKWRVG